MNDQPLYIVDIIGEVVAATSAKLTSVQPGSTEPVLPKQIDYLYGRSIQILTQLQELTNSITLKGTKYPLFALFQDFPEQMNSGYYTTVRFPKIMIATLTSGTDPVAKKYAENFKPILYPIFEEFKRQLCRHKNIVGNDPNAFSMMKWDRPGTQPAADKTKASNFNDYVDAIEIQNLELTFKKVNHCKQI